MAVHHVSLRRPDPSYTWGFRLQGGIDYQLPLSVESVAPGTVADRCGLARGDFVVGINGQPTDYLQHEAAKMAIIRSGNEVALTVRRGGGSGGVIHDDYESGGGGVNVWRPSVQSVTQLYQQHQQQQQQHQQQHHHQAQQQQHHHQAQQQHHHAPPARPNAGRFPTGSGSMFADLPKVTNTSLAANKSDTSMRHYDNNYNSSPRPFTPHGYAYGPAAVARHRGGGGGSNSLHSPHLHDSTNAPAGSHGYRQVRPPEPGVPRPAPCGGGGGLTCAACGEIVRGVFVNVQGRLPMHPECLKCATCGVGLRHCGYYCVEDRVFCEAHARAATAGGL